MLLRVGGRTRPLPGNLAEERFQVQDRPVAMLLDVVDDVAFIKGARNAVFDHRQAVMLAGAVDDRAQTVQVEEWMAQRVVGQQNLACAEVQRRR